MRQTVAIHISTSCHKLGLCSCKSCLSPSTAPLFLSGEDSNTLLPDGETETGLRFSFGLKAAKDRWALSIKHIFTA